MLTLTGLVYSQCKSHLESDETIFADKKREVDQLNETIKDMVSNFNVS